MKQQQKTTVTLSMIWLGAMMIASQPSWIRNALDFVRGSTTTVVTHGGAATAQDTGPGGNFKVSSGNQ